MFMEIVLCHISQVKELVCRDETRKMQDEDANSPYVDCGAVGYPRVHFPIRALAIIWDRMLDLRSLIAMRSNIRHASSSRGNRSTTEVGESHAVSNLR